MLSRRQFLQAAAVSPLLAQTGQPWGGPVLDSHLHFRAQQESNLRHMDGSGVTAAVLLTDLSTDSQAKALMEMYPKRLLRFTGTNVTRPDAVDALRKAVQAGSAGLGELKSRVAADGPEMRRIYGLAAELKV